MGLKIMVEGPLQKYINIMVHDSQFKCHESTSYLHNFTSSIFKSFEAQSSMSTTTPLSVIIFTLLILFHGLFWGYQYLFPRMKRCMHKNSLNPGMHYRDEDTKNEVDGMIPPLCISPDVPILIRIFIPVILLGTTSLFIMAHISNAVFIELLVFSPTVDSALDVYNRSIFQTTFDLWKLDLKGESAFIFIIFILLPYFEQATAIILWLTKPQLVPYVQRERTYHTIIVLSKLTMLPLFIFINIITIATVKFRSPIQLSSFVPENLLSFQPSILPDKGMCAFFSAHFVLQCTMLIMLYYRRLVRSNRLHLSDETLKQGVTDTLSGDEEETNTCNNKTEDVRVDSLHTSWKHHYIISLSLVVSSSLIIIFVLWAFFAPSFIISFEGVLGAYIAELRYSYSICTILEGIFSHMQKVSDASSHFGIVLISLVIICILVIPICQVTVQLVRWFALLSLSRQKSLIAATEILDTFQYLEIYVVGLVLSIWLTRRASMSINEKCSAVTDALAAVALYDIRSQPYKQCIQISADLKTASILLLVSAFLLHTVKYIIATRS
jgi:hypothetical protein